MIVKLSAGTTKEREESWKSLLTQRASVEVKFSRNFSMASVSVTESHVTLLTLELAILVAIM